MAAETAWEELSLSQEARSAWAPASSRPLPLARKAWRQIVGGRRAGEGEDLPAKNSENSSESEAEAVSLFSGFRVKPLPHNP